MGAKRFFLIRGAELAGFALLAAVPFAVDSSYALGLLTLLAIYGILLIGLDITVGYLGQVNLGHAAFMGLGAYAAALCVERLGFGLFPALAAALLAGFVFGGLLAFPALRLEGPQFALATLSFLMLSATTLNEWVGLTGGAQGLQLRRPDLFGVGLGAQGFYWFCLVFLALFWTLMRNLLASQWGRAFEALRDSPIAADAMGVGTFRHKVAAFAIGSSLAGFAGGLYAFDFKYLQPGVFTYDLMVILLLGVVLGGRKSLWGAFVGACIIVLLPNLLSNRRLFQELTAAGLLVAVVAGGRGLWKKTVRPFEALAPVAALTLLTAGGLFVASTEDWRKGIFALMLFSVVVGLPEGLMGFVTPLLCELFGLPPVALPSPASLVDVLPAKRATGETVLEVRDLKRHFGGVKAVDGVSMKVRRGSVHGLIGPNGSGKSTLVNVVSGLYAPSGGRVFLRGRPLAEGSLFDVARAGVSRTFQNLQLFGELSALDNVMAAMTDAYRRPFLFILLGLGRSEEKRARAASLALLELVGLAAEARVRARDLPHGAQRFLEIARALARKPEVLLLDEPAAGMALPDVSRLQEVMRRVHERGITVILIEHHMDVVSAMCGFVTVLDGGKVIAEGSPAEVKRDPKVIEAYLGVA